MLTQQERIAEKRKSRRYILGNNAYALLKQPQYKELGKIIDISRTGISFLCINQGDWTEKNFEADLIVGTGPGHGAGETPVTLKNIPLLPVIYCRDEEQGNNVAGTVMKRCGVKFGPLSPEQKRMLDQFILSYSCGSA